MRIAAASPDIRYGKPYFAPSKCGTAYGILSKQRYKGFTELGQFFITDAGYISEFFQTPWLG